MKGFFSIKKAKQYVCIFLMLCIVLGMVLHVIPYIYNRSLWLDEAMLVSSICTRSFSQLISSPLDWGQSSPIGWLFVVKLITMVFGTSVAALRIWSLISAFGCIALVFLLLYNHVGKNYALLVTAVFSLTDQYIYYSNEAKPYMSDNFCCLIALFIWQKYKDGKLTLLPVCIAFSVLIWFSFSAVFFVAACMIIECFGSIKRLIKERKNKSKERNNKTIKRLATCALVLVSFILNYIFWLSKASDNAGEEDYWALLRFPLIPTSLSDIKLIIKMALQFWSFYPSYIAALFIFLFLIYVIICIKKKSDKSQLLIPFLVSLVLLLVASFCGFYPITGRLVQAYAIVVIILGGYACDEIEISHNNNLSVVKQIDWTKIFFYGILTGCLALVGMSGCKNFFPQHVYKSRSEVAESIQYLEDNLTDHDVVYVCRYALPVYTYETGYQITYDDLISELPQTVDNTIFGQLLFTYEYQIPYEYAGEENMDAIKEDAQLILENESVYLFTSHDEHGIPELIETLEEYGEVEVVVDSYDTHLYHFIKENKWS